MTSVTPKTNYENHLKNKQEIERLDKRTNKIYELVKNYHTSVFERFPLLFSVLGSIGLALTFYGFEKVIDELPFFADRPEIVLVSGLVILLITGTMYKLLD